VTRLLLVLVVVLFFVLCAAAMWWGYRNRARRQAEWLPEFPAVPEWLTRDSADTDRQTVLPPATGVYVSTTLAGDWQNRIAVGDVGFRSAGTLELYPDGLLIDRTGASPVWIPAGSLLHARTDRALAGKVMGIAGLLVVRWRLGEHELDTGFRGDDKAVYRNWVDAVRVMAERNVGARGARGKDQT
jgi:hypothetical protein